MKEFYKGKKVFISGHNGFKGSWLCQILLEFGAEICGYSLSPTLENKLFSILNLHTKVQDNCGDIGDLFRLKKVFDDFQPEIVFHLAAQPIVIESYNNPLFTYQTNVMGTVNILECCRQSSCVKSIINVTTDKVYKNNEWIWGYRENEELCGFDPYSNSKSCSELVSSCYRNSFFNAKKIPLSTMRAGNVIGGGDFSANRIVPDLVRAALSGEKMILRNPNSVRPYQHVLEPIFAYLLVAKKQYENFEFASQYNVGPNENDCITNRELCDIFVKHYKGNLQIEHIESKEKLHEANFLKLDCAKIRKTFNWKPKYNIDDALKLVAQWLDVYASGEDVCAVTLEQIREYARLSDLSNAD